MKWTRTPLLLAAVALFGPSVASAQVSSGPGAGSKAEPFSAFVAVGDDPGKSADVVAGRKDKPTVYLFVHKDHWERPMARFIKVLDGELEKGVEGAKDAAAVAVWLTDDKQQSKDYLPIAQQSLSLKKTDWTVFEGELAGPNGWAISEKAFLTVVVVRGGKVVNSFGYISVNESDVPEVVKSLKKAAE